ncbi:hypothetical protein JTE90_015893 [Oedothorax gibbosus]|uniref:JmjC domain-containing protein n=1 Tax=Oedothorax gibbosus TaxID=931172 RepID=A0AAV6VVT9_9ARAC|nr:hypothetical protein JTE90_015893 [Oedothorax gibbosus]
MDLQKYKDIHPALLGELCEEYSDLLPSEIPVLHQAPDALSFLRNYVTPSIPFIVKNGIKHWPAIKKWSKEYLRSKLGDKTCTVAITPDGYADAVVEDMFMVAEEKSMTFNQFLDELENPQLSRVLYLQKQNNCLMDEYSCLVHDVDFHIPWATEAFGEFPEASNFWMGDRRAITSLHKDNYENLYCVVKGVKEFILYPPTASAWMPYGSFKTGKYHYENSSFKILDICNEVKWITMDPFVKITTNNPLYPLYSKTKEYVCNVCEGDILYLPALWFHHVRQSHACVAVNYWYEMNFLKYPYFCFLEKLGKLATS